MFINFETEKCISCFACSEACKKAHDLKETETAFCQITEWPELSARICLHCKEASCIRECFMGCFYRDSCSGLVLCDNRSCIRCGRCVFLCPFHAIVFRADGRADKCDACCSRPGDPACVAACPTGALTLAVETKT